MIIELLRLDNNQRIAISRHHVDDLWGWAIESLLSEFPCWWNSDIDSSETPEGEVLTIDGAPKAILKYTAGWDAMSVW